MKRTYETLIKQHFNRSKQPVFLTGARRIGKTFISQIAKNLAADVISFDWDNPTQRKIILEGAKAFQSFIHTKNSPTLPVFIFDGLHKYRQSDQFLKEFFNQYTDRVKVIVIGASDFERSLNSKSAIKRHLSCQIHPLSVAECVRTTTERKDIHPNRFITSATFNTLFEFGGYPEPFQRRNHLFSKRWNKQFKQQIFREDFRDLSRIQELDRLETLADLLKEQAGQLVNYSYLANKLNVSIDTVQRWVNLLCEFHYCYLIKPWSKDVTRSLLKEPKLYLYDWSVHKEVHQKTENFIASHLLKAVHFWTDQGLGNYDLYFVRDKEKREVDFLVVRNNQPWFLVEGRYEKNALLSDHLEIFQAQTKARHAFQVAINMPYENIDCFSYQKPVIVPAKTFLSQLV